MDELHKTWMLSLNRRVLSWVIIVVLTGSLSSVIAKDYSEGFEGDANSWRFERGVSRTAVLRQARTSEIWKQGARSEAFQVETFANDGRASLVHSLPASVRIDELRTSVWLWSDQPGIQVVVRVRLPYQIDPRTEQSLVVDVFGGIHSGEAQWQQLTVDLSDRVFNETMRRVRNDLDRRVGIRAANIQGAYIDQISLRLPQDRAASLIWNLAIDDLELTPHVSPQGQHAVPDLVKPTGPRIQIGDDRVRLDGQPLFPLFVPYHGESPESLGKSLCNIVWVPDYEDRSLLQQLTAAGLGIMATPPQPDLETDTPEEAGLLPFTDHTDPIMWWMLDIQIPSSRLQQAAAWAEMVRDADRTRARPIMADVMGHEREFHRELSSVGASRSFLHTSKTPLSNAATLDQRRQNALPGKPTFTLISTEPALELIASRPAHATVPVVEPEQIWMQGFIALAAGFKGLGYLTLESLESKTLGAEERRRAMELMNYQIRLLEPWLATAKVLQQARVQVGRASGSQPSALHSNWDYRPGIVDETPEGIAARQIQATVLQCDQGLLILLNWLDDTGQYQPGWMVANDVQILVNRDLVQACELTTTGLHEHTLQLTPVAGGTTIRLREFNQSAIILVPSDPDAKQALTAQLRQVHSMASEAWSSLARAKLTRVRPVHHQLVQSQAPRVDRAEDVLRDASNWVDQAEKLHAAGRFTEVEKPARMALAYLRSLQHSHWKNAVGRSLSPATSPHAICFQTLPDHYRMKASLKLSGFQSLNLLPSGGFENSESVLTGWSRMTELPDDSPLITTAALVGSPGESCLHLGAALRPNQVPLASLEQIPVSMASPAIPVRAGQFVRVQGRIRIQQRIEATTEGVLIYDSLMGTVGALRFRDPTSQGDWQEFEFIREVARSGELRLLFELRGMGNVWLDDLRVYATIPVEPEHETTPSLTAPASFTGDQTPD